MYFVHARITYSDVNYFATIGVVSRELVWKYIHRHAKAQFHFMLDLRNICIKQLKCRYTWRCIVHFNVYMIIVCCLYVMRAQLQCHLWLTENIYEIKASKYSCILMRCHFHWIVAITINIHRYLIEKIHKQ